MLDHYGIKVRYNVIKKRLDYDIPGLKTSIDNQDNASIQHILSLASLNRFSTQAITGYVETIADAHPVNPVLDWIKSKPWDGQDRIHSICQTLVVPQDYPPQIRDIFVTKWLRSAVAALCKQHFRARGVLTLQGAQGLGKTAWVRSLIPDAALRESVLKLDHHLDAGDKDSKLLGISHWITELGELDSSLKKDIARLKGFLTADTDKIRRPYAKTESEYARRTVFCATVNDENFLVDPTGNSRFWTIPVVGINYEHHIDMQQVFAQALAQVQDGLIWWLDRDEEDNLTELNKRHRAVSAIREMVLDVAVKAGQRGAQGPSRVSASQFLSVHGHIKSPTTAQAKEAAQALRELYGEPVTRSGGVVKWDVYIRADIQTHPHSSYHQAASGGPIYDDEDF